MITPSLLMFERDWFDERLLLLLTVPFPLLEEERLRFTLLPELLERLDERLLFTVPLPFELLRERLLTVEDDRDRVVPLDLLTVPRLLVVDTFRVLAFDRTELLGAAFLTRASDRVRRFTADPRDVKPFPLGL